MPMRSEEQADAMGCNYMRRNAYVNPGRPARYCPDTIRRQPMLLASAEWGGIRTLGQRNVAAREKVGGTGAFAPVPARYIEEGG